MILYSLILQHIKISLIISHMSFYSSLNQDLIKVHHLHLVVMCLNHPQFRKVLCFSHDTDILKRAGQRFG